MKDWVKLNSFDSLYKAELRKKILKDNEINAIIIPKKDSAFLLGEIEIYVESVNLDSARRLIDEFLGWTKINSFNLAKPVHLLDKIIEKSGIETMFLEKSEVFHLIDNFELYVRNHDAPKAKEVITRLDGWQVVEVMDYQKQACHRVKLLQDNDIDTIIVKQRDSAMHVEAIKIYAGSNNFERAAKLLKELSGWKLVVVYENVQRAELTQTHLENEEIDVIARRIFTDGTIAKIELYVQDSKQEEANDIINRKQKWDKLCSFSSIVQAEYVNELLKESELESMLMVVRDSAFLIGSIDIYVVEKHFEKAIDILKKYEHIEAIKVIDEEADE